MSISAKKALILRAVGNETIRDSFNPNTVWLRLSDGSVDYTARAAQADRPAQMVGQLGLRRDAEQAVDRGHDIVRGNGGGRRIDY